MMETFVHQFDVTIYHLRFECEAQTIVHFGPQVGAQLRGGLWAALQRFACTDQRARTDPNHNAHCPMCRLMALETLNNPRGVNPARPFAIQPPLTGSYFHPGEHFLFGISLFGDVAALVPYVIQAVHHMGHIGVGYGRGQFVLRDVTSVQVAGDSAHPLMEWKQALLLDGRVALNQLLPTSREQIQNIAAHLPRSSVRLRFLTPTQIVANKQFDTSPDFSHLIARLLERCQSIQTYYASDPTDQPFWQTAHARLSELARNVQLARNQTRWMTVKSGSRRDNSSKPMSGFVGEAVFEGNLLPFREWLVWGQSLHIGKNAVKGNGWYQIVV